MPRSRGTSITEWSDQGTEMPVPIDASLTDSEYEDVYALRGKGARRDHRRDVDFQEEEKEDSAPLIDFEDDAAEKTTTTKTTGMGEETKPADRLKMLLRQMEMEVIDSTPVAPRTMTQPVKHVEKHVEEEVKGWRSGRRLGLGHEVERRHVDAPSSPEMHIGELDEDGDDAIESPPTPPLRLHNPYLARRNDREFKQGYLGPRSLTRNCSSIPIERWSIAFQSSRLTEPYVKWKHKGPSFLLT